MSLVATTFADPADLDGVDWSLLEQAGVRLVLNTAGDDLRWVWTGDAVARASCPYASSKMFVEIVDWHSMVIVQSRPALACTCPWCLAQAPELDFASNLLTAASRALARGRVMNEKWWHLPAPHNARWLARLARVDSDFPFGVNELEIDDWQAMPTEVPELAQLLVQVNTALGHTLGGGHWEVEQTTQRMLKRLTGRTFTFPTDPGTPGAWWVLVGRGSVVERDAEGVACAALLAVPQWRQLMIADASTVRAALIPAELAETVSQQLFPAVVAPASARDDDVVLSLLWQMAEPWLRERLAYHVSRRGELLTLPTGQAKAAGRQWIDAARTATQVARTNTVPAQQPA